MEDPVDQLLAEVEAEVNGPDSDFWRDPSQLELFERGNGPEGGALHQVRLPDGHTFRGSWHDIVRHMRDHAGFSHETIPQYMRRLAERWHEQSGAVIPFQDPQGFLRAAIAARLLKLEDDAF
jgi:hypothetical protein